MKKLAILLLTVMLAQLVTTPGAAVGLGYTPTGAYAGSEYCSRLKMINLTGDQRLDIVNVAYTQLGYHEGDGLAEINGKNTKGSKNYTEYAYWFGTEVMGRDEGFYFAWCAMFVSWCARQANIPESIVSNAAYARPDSADRRGGYGYFHLDAIAPQGYEPKCGDLIFIDWEADGTWDHVGLVTYFINGYVGTIEGNANDGTVHRVYRADDPVIKAYGSPAYKGECPEEVRAAYEQRALISSVLDEAALRAAGFGALLVGSAG